MEVLTGSDAPVIDRLSNGLRVMMFEGTTKAGAREWASENVDGKIESVQVVGDLAGSVIVSVKLDEG